MVAAWMSFVPARSAGEGRQCDARPTVLFCTGKFGAKPYLEAMIRSAPPAPFKTALLTFAISIAIALVLAAAPHPY